MASEVDETNLNKLRDYNGLMNGLATYCVLMWNIPDVKHE